MLCLTLWALLHVCGRLLLIKRVPSKGPSSRERSSRVHEQALAWYFKAAAQGEAQAQCNAVTFVEKGLGGVAVDHEAALELYLKRLIRAWQGRRSMQVSVITRARSWYAKAAAQGDEGARASLARLPA